MNRVYLITYTDGHETEQVYFTVQNLSNKFEEEPTLKDTELAYTLYEEIEQILDMNLNETRHFFLDRAKTEPCLLSRTL